MCWFYNDVCIQNVFYTRIGAPIFTQSYPIYDGELRLVDTLMKFTVFSKASKKEKTTEKTRDFVEFDFGYYYYFFFETTNEYRNSKHSPNAWRYIIHNFLQKKIFNY